MTKPLKKIVQQAQIEPAGPKRGNEPISMASINALVYHALYIKFSQSLICLQNRRQISCFLLPTDFPWCVLRNARNTLSRTYVWPPAWFKRERGSYEIKLISLIKDHLKQTDMIILAFAKAFDKVSFYSCILIEYEMNITRETGHHHKPMTLTACFLIWLYIYLSRPLFIGEVKGLLTFLPLQDWDIASTVARASFWCTSLQNVCQLWSEAWKEEGRNSSLMISVCIISLLILTLS